MDETDADAAAPWGTPGMAWFANDRGETIEVDTFPERLACDPYGPGETWTLTWGSDGVAYLHLR